MVLVVLVGELTFDGCCGTGERAQDGVGPEGQPAHVITPQAWMGEASRGHAQGWVAVGLGPGASDAELQAARMARRISRTPNWQPN